LINEDLRKGHGVYYTPSKIVNYMCQESLINYLENEFEGKINRLEFESLIKHGEYVITKTDAKQIDDKLANIRVCDPAVGAGAFLISMMLEIVKARNVLTNYLSEINNRTIYNFKRHCIKNCLYGVDIDSSVVYITKLRLWLSLVSNEKDITILKSLPNLDYKLICGNSLIGIERSLFNNHLFKLL